MPRPGGLVFLALLQGLLRLGSTADASALLSHSNRGGPLRGTLSKGRSKEGSAKRAPGAPRTLSELLALYKKEGKGQQQSRNERQTPILSGPIPECYFETTKVLESCSWYRDYLENLTPEQEQEFEYPYQWHDHKEGPVGALCRKEYNETCIQGKIEAPCDECEFANACHAFKNRSASLPDVRSDMKPCAVKYATTVTTTTSTTTEYTDHLTGKGVWANAGAEDIPGMYRDAEPVTFTAKRGAGEKEKKEVTLHKSNFDTRKKSKKKAKRTEEKKPIRQKASIPSQSYDEVEEAD